MLVAYEIVGCVVYFTMFNTGTAPDMPGFLAQMVGQVAVVGFVDMFLTNIWAVINKTPAAAPSFLVKLAA